MEKWGENEVDFTFCKMMIIKDLKILAGKKVKNIKTRKMRNLLLTISGLL